MLDGAGRDREVDHIHRLIVVHHGVDQAAGKGIAAADTIQNIKGIELGLERVTLVPHKGFQAVLTAGVDIAHMAGNALEVGVTVDEMLENFVLLLIAGLQGDAVLPVALSMILFVLPQVVRLDAEQYINVGQALGAVVAGILPGPQRGTEVAVKADGQALLLGSAQAAQDKIGAVFVQRRGNAGQVQPVEAVKQLIQIDLGQVVLGQGAVHTVIDDLAGADAVAGLKVIGAQAVAGGFFLGGEDHRRAVDVIAAEPADGAFAQGVVGHNAEEGGIHAEVRQSQRNVCLAAAVTGLESGSHADLFIVRRGQAQHHFADSDKLLRAAVAHQDRIAVFHGGSPPVFAIFC